MTDLHERITLTFEPIDVIEVLELIPDVEHHPYRCLCRVFDSVQWMLAIDDEDDVRGKFAAM